MNKPFRFAHSVTHEFDLHIYTAQLLTLCAAPDLVWWHTPNGEYRSPRTGARLKKMGVKRGVADFAMVLPTRGRAAFLELKSSTGRLSDDQRIFQMASIKAGALYAAANSPEAVQTILTEWGAIVDAGYVPAKRQRDPELTALTIEAELLLPPLEGETV